MIAMVEKAVIMTMLKSWLFLLYHFQRMDSFDCQKSENHPCYVFFCLFFLCMFGRGGHGGKHGGRHGGRYGGHGGQHSGQHGG